MDEKFFVAFDQVIQIIVLVLNDLVAIHDLDQAVTMVPKVFRCAFGNSIALIVISITELSVTCQLVVLPGLEIFPVAVGIILIRLVRFSDVIIRIAVKY